MSDNAFFLSTCGAWEPLACIDWLEPISGRRLWQHRPPACVAPQIAGDIFQFEGVDGVPLLLQPVCTGADPQDGGHAFHD